ncbi:hypothetical protein ACNKHL_12830 [Shigella flexneri]
MQLAGGGSRFDVSVKEVDGSESTYPVPHGSQAKYAYPVFAIMILRRVVAI